MAQTAERHRESQRRYRDANPEKVQESSRRHYAKNRERMCARTNLWKRENRDKVRAANERLLERGRAIVAEELARRGGHCIADDCGESEGLHWHHRHPATKEFSICSTGEGRSAERLRAELAKCDPYCARHHTLEHVRMRKEGLK